VICFFKKVFEFMDDQEVGDITVALLEDLNAVEEQRLHDSLSMLSWLIDVRPELVRFALANSHLTQERVARWPLSCASYFMEHLKVLLAG
jgi:hypothetical protein